MLRVKVHLNSAGQMPLHSFVKLVKDSGFVFLFSKLDLVVSEGEFVALFILQGTFFGTNFGILYSDAAVETHNKIGIGFNTHWPLVDDGRAICN